MLGSDWLCSWMLCLVDDEFDKSPQETDHCFARRLYQAAESWRVQMLRTSSGWISLPFLASQYHNHQAQRHTAQRGQERHEVTWIESRAQLASWVASKSICWFGLCSKDADSWLLATKTKQSVHSPTLFPAPKESKAAEGDFCAERGGDRMVPDYRSKPEDNSWHPEDKQSPGNEASFKRPE